MTPTTSPTAALVELACGSAYGAPPVDVLAATKRVILDTLGCAIAGLATDIGRCVRQLKVEQGGSPEATLFASNARLPAGSVSYVHAQAANAMDADETLLHQCHFASCIVFPALAIAEKVGASGRELLEAVALGFDVGARVILSVPHYDVDEHEVRNRPMNTHSCAVFGAVAAVGRLLGFSAEQMAHGFGIGYASTPIERPRWQTLSFHERQPMIKYAMYGAIAEAGVNAALLAKIGFTAHTEILDPPAEFWRSFAARPYNPEFILRDLGRRWFISETSFKPYPVGRQANIPIDLFAQIARRESLAMEEIDEVVVRVPPARLVMDLAKNADVRVAAAAPFSVAYSLAMIADGLPPGPKWHRRENLKNARYRGFMEKVRSEVRPDWLPTMIEQIKAEGTYRRIPTEVEVRARGRSFTAFSEYAKGDPWTPETVMSDEDLHAKFREFTSGVLAPGRAEDAIQAVAALERSSDVTRLASALL